MQPDKAEVLDLEIFLNNDNRDSVTIIRENIKKTQLYKKRKNKEMISQEELIPKLLIFV